MELATSPGYGAAMDHPLAKRGKMRPLLAATALAGVCIGAGAWMVSHPVPRSLSVESWKLQVSAVSLAPYHDFIPLHGQVVPQDSIVLDAEQDGRVEQVLVEAGQTVRAGQPLVRLSNPTLQLEAIARETQLIEQMNNQRTLQLSFETTRTNDTKAVADAEYNIVNVGHQLVRRAQLAASGFESQERLEQSVDEFAYQKRLRLLALDAASRDTAVVAKSAAMMAEMAQRLQENLAAAKHLVDVLIVRAPADGVLTGLEAHVGEEKSRGQHLGQIDRNTGFKVSAELDEFYLARIKLGQHVSIALDGASADLVVRKIYPQVKDGKFAIDMAWQGAAPSGLRRGQAVQGRLELGDDTQAEILPAGPFLENSGGAWVFVLDQDGHGASRRAVTLGRRNAEAVEVLGGLKPGDRVVTSDYTGLDRIDRLAISF